MPIVNLSLINKYPIVQANIGVSKPRAQIWEADGLGAPKAITVNLLIDTGASATCIDPDILSRLSLTPSGETSIQTPSTNGAPHDCLLYDISLLLSAEANDPHHIEALAVIGSTLSDHAIDGLLGRDVLERCVFIFNGLNDTFTLAY